MSWVLIIFQPSLISTGVCLHLNIHLFFFVSDEHLRKIFFFFQNTVWSVQILVPAGCLWGKQSFSKAVTQPGPLRSAVCVWHQVTWLFSYFSSLRGNYISQWRNYPCIVSDSMNMLRPSDVSAVFFLLSGSGAGNIKVHSVWGAGKNLFISFYQWNDLTFICL